MPSNDVRAPAVYGWAFIAVAVAGLLRWWFDPLLGDHLPFVTFFVSVAAMAWLGGLRPALLASGLGFLVALYFFVPPRNSFALPSGPHLFGLAMYFMVCLAFALFGEAMHATRRGTERERVKGLAERERFRLAAAAVNGSIYEYDITTGHVERQRGLYDLLGYRAEEIAPTAAWWLQQTHPDDRAANEKSLAESAGDSLISVYRVRHKDGRWLHVEDRAVLVRGEGGQPMKMIGCTVDVTERKEAEDLLRYSEQLHRIAFNQSPAGMACVKADGRFSKVNQAMCEIAGYSAEELVGMKVSELTHPDDRARDAQLFDPFLRGDTPSYENDKRYVRKDGGVRWVSVTTRMVTDTEDRPLHTVAVVLDITARKRAEAEHRDAQRQIATTLESITDGFTRFDRDWRVVYMNDEAERINQRPRAEMLGKTAWELFPALVGTQLEAEYRRCVAEQVTVEFDYHYEPWHRWYALKCYPTPEGGLVAFIRDTTEHKAAEERVLASDARLRQVFESNVIGMIRWDLNRSLILDANAEFLRMTGYVRDDVMAGRLNFRELTPPEWTAQNEGGIHAIRSGGHAAPYEKEYFRKDGSRLPLIIAGTRFEDSPSEGMSFLVDISEMKRAEAVLRASEQRHSYLLRLADVLRRLSDPIEVQAEACRVLGEQLGANRVAYFEVQGNDYVVERDYTAAVTPLRGRYPTRSFGPEMLADFCAGRTASESDVNTDPRRPQADRDAFAAIQVRSYVGVPLLKDGQFVAGLAVNSASPRAWTPTEIVMIEDTAQWTWGAVAQARVAAALRESEFRFSVALKNSRVVVFNTDAALRYTWVHNPHPAFSAADILGRRDDELISAEQAAPLTAIKQGVLNSGVGGRGEFAVDVNGERFVYDLTVEPLRDERQNVVGVTVAAMDITERKKTEDDLRRLGAELADTGRRKDEFLATLAHELRNPLAPIRNGLQVMRLAGVKPEVIEKTLAMMERQVGQLIHLIDDLMDLSRISAGKIDLQKARLRLADVIQDAVDTSRPLIDERRHALVVDVLPEPVSIDADRTRLVQMFSNLLNNAAKYTETGGRIRVAIERDGGDVVVAVQDNGVGISAPMLTRVFDMFAQVDRSLEKSQGGLGIGLSIAKRLAEMHDGSIVAQSGGHGLGSRFVVRLPVVVNDTIDRPDDYSHAQKAKPARRRILVVDDNRDGASSLAEMLDLMGNDTQTAYDGAQAVEAAEAFKPDVILLDIGMPKLNGYDACRRIRTQPWGRSIVIVAQTGWGQEDDKRKAQEAGFDFHMVKPVDPAAFEKVLAEMKATVG